MIGYKINQILAAHILMQIAPHPPPPPPPPPHPPPPPQACGMKNLPTQPLVLSTSPRLSGQWSLWHFRNEQNVWSDLTLCNTRIKDHLAIWHDCSKFWAWRLDFGDKWNFHKALSSWSNNSILFFFLDICLTTFAGAKIVQILWCYGLSCNLIIGDLIIRIIVSSVEFYTMGNLVVWFIV